MSENNKDNGFTPLGATLDNDDQPTVELPPTSENGMFFMFLNNGIGEEVNTAIHTDDNGITCMIY